jgi:hypothetical protein
VKPTNHTLENMEASDSGTLHAFRLSKVLYNREAGEVGPTCASSPQRCWAVECAKANQPCLCCQIVATDVLAFGPLNIGNGKISIFGRIYNDSCAYNPTTKGLGAGLVQS